MINLESCGTSVGLPDLSHPLVDGEAGLALHVELHKLESTHEVLPHPLHCHSAVRGDHPGHVSLGGAYYVVDLHVLGYVTANENYEQYVLKIKRSRNTFAFGFISN